MIELNKREKAICVLLNADSEMDNFIYTPENYLIGYHMSLGQWIRNKWLWKEYDECHPDHPDDESFNMIIELHRKLNANKTSKE